MLHITVPPTLQLPNMKNHLHRHHWRPPERPHEDPGSTDFVANPQKVLHSCIKRYDLDSKSSSRIDTSVKQEYLSRPMRKSSQEGTKQSERRKICVGLNHWWRTVTSVSASFPPAQILDGQTHAETLQRNVNIERSQAKDL